MLGKVFCNSLRELGLTIARGFVGKDVDDVDVRTKVQLLASELANSDDGKLVFAGSVFFIKLAPRIFQHHLNDGVGQPRQFIRDIAHEHLAGKIPCPKSQDLLNLKLVHAGTYRSSSYWPRIIQ